jgi:hypothetical protein
MKNISQNNFDFFSVIRPAAESRYRERRNRIQGDPSSLATTTTLTTTTCESVTIVENKLSDLDEVAEAVKILQDSVNYISLSGAS